jgi:hypothetical protein
VFLGLRACSANAGKNMNQTEVCRIARQDGSLQPQFSDRTTAPSTARSLRRSVLQLHADIWFSGCAIFWKVPTRPMTWASYLEN